MTNSICYNDSNTITSIGDCNSTNSISINDCNSSWAYVSHPAWLEYTISEESIKNQAISYKTPTTPATITKVIFNGPATVVYWSDGDKTIVKQSKLETAMDKEKGLAMAIIKKAYKDAGKEGNYFKNIFGKWIEDED